MASTDRSVPLAVCIFALTACSDLSTQPSPLVSSSPAAEPAYVLQKTVEAYPPNGNARTLKQGSLWTEFGTVTEGTVYRPRGGVLTAEGLNVREAYIVVRDGTWVGFWLPVEKAFAPVAAPVPIPMQRGEQH